VRGNWEIRKAVAVERFIPDLKSSADGCSNKKGTTFGKNTKVQFGCLLSTALSSTIVNYASTKNQHCLVRSKSIEEMCRFTLLALISVCKVYYFNLPSCVALQMAMIRGYRTILLSCPACYTGLNEWKQKPRI